MSYRSGISALNMEFTDRVPRTEYSVDSYHWELIQKVTGIDTTIQENKEKARKEFVKKWDYAFTWSAPSSTEIIHTRGRATRMGHAEFAKGGTDKDNHIECPFKSVEEIYEFDPYEEYGELDQKQLIKQLNEQYRKIKDYWEGITNGIATITVKSTAVVGNVTINCCNSAGLEGSVAAIQTIHGNAYKLKNDVY